MNKLKLTATTITAFMISAVASATAPRVVEKKVPGGYKITIVNFVGDDQNIAQAMIAPNAQRLCGSRTPQWGRFSLNAMIIAAKGKSLKPGRFEQEIRCVEPVPVAANVTAGPFMPTDADEATVRSAALKFLSFRDAGNVEESFDMLAPGMRDTTDRTEWNRTVSAMPAKVGNRVDRRVVKVTWYVDPPGVDAGVYAAADFDGRSSGLAVHCGYVAVKRQASGDYLVVRIEEGNLPASVAKGMTPDKIVEMRTALQCRN